MSKKKLFVICALLFIVDSLTKLFFLSNQNLKLDVIPQVLSLEFTKNYGISFGLFSGNGLITIIIPIVIIGVLFALLRKQTNKGIVIGICLIILGAVSNLFDRLIFGYVVDFIDVKMFVCNISDIYIFIGALLLILKWRYIND